VPQNVPYAFAVHYDPVEKRLYTVRAQASHESLGKTGAELGDLPFNLFTIIFYLVTGQSGNIFINPGFSTMVRVSMPFCYSTGFAVLTYPKQRG
jgi:hypothetical protein